MTGSIAIGTDSRAKFCSYQQYHHNISYKWCCDVYCFDINWFIVKMSHNYLYIAGGESEISPYEDVVFVSPKSCTKSNWDTSFNFLLFNIIKLQRWVLEIQQDLVSLIDAYAIPVDVRSRQLSLSDVRWFVTSELDFWLSYIEHIRAISKVIHGRDRCIHLPVVKILRHIRTICLDISNDICILHIF